MVKFSAIALCGLLSSVMISTADAQSPLSLSIRGGVNVADFSGVTYNTDTRTGGMVGASVGLSIPLLPVDLETGLYYSQKGTRLVDSDPDVGDTTLTFMIDYLEIPLIAMYNLGTPGLVTPYLLAGPYIGFNVNAETEIAFGDIVTTEDLSGFTRPADVGFLIGAGSRFNIGIAVLSLQFRYSHGLTQVFDDDFDDGEYNSVLNLTFGYHF